MKLIHLADLHLGKRLYEFPILEDQKYILMEILRIIDLEMPDGILIAGDVYDKAVPPTEAVELFDQFLVSIAKREIPAFIISGNHDSPERLAFGNRLIDVSGIHLSSVYDGSAAQYCLQDEYGEVSLFMLPFLKPTAVRRFFPDKDIVSYTDAMCAAVEQMQIDPSRRNILVSHQFVTGAERSNSEDVSVGGMDNVDASVFDGFDYVALGHIHTPQNLDSCRIRYAGTPLKYSFSEASRGKSVTVVELGSKGALEVRDIPLTPRHDMTELKGSFEALTSWDFYHDTPYPNDYVHITLTDENDVPDAVGKLRMIYPMLLKLDYDNARSRSGTDLQKLEKTRQESPLELFSDFYERCNHQSMTEEQSEYLQKIMEEIWEDEA